MMKTAISIAAAALGVFVATPTTARAACNNDMACNGGPARVMFIVDASSDRLNDANGAAPEATSEWDIMRRVLADPVSSVYDATVDNRGVVASQVTHIGVIAFGDAAPAPGEQTVMVDYGPCTQERVDWALDPNTSCADPGCTDPWAGPPITWTFVDGSTVDPPNFFLPTLSHMPRCNTGGGQGCAGSGRFVHLGIELARTNRQAYVASTPFTNDANTSFVNVLLVGDSYAGASTEPEVQAALEGALAEGTLTYVVGFGRALQNPNAVFEAELMNMAAWGSGGTQAHFEAPTEGALAQALGEIMADLDVPCCHTIDCAPFGGADDGGGGGTMGDTASTWGSADGDGSASASDSAGSVGGTMSATASDTETGADSGKIDDDGGCTCRTGDRGFPSSVLWLLLMLARRRCSGRLCDRGAR